MKKLLSIFPFSRYTKNEIHSSLSSVRVLLRYFLKRKKNPLQFDALPAVCINLEHREDRRDAFIENFAPFHFIRYEFLKAIPFVPGTIGCTLSHISAILKNKDRSYFMIVEDDFKFIVEPQVIESIITEFLSNTSLDVLCLGNNTNRPSYRVGPHLRLAFDIQTTSCYIVKREAVLPILHDFTSSLYFYAKGYASNFHACDMTWKISQVRKLSFCIPVEQIGIQLDGFSDIEHRTVSYNC